ERALVERRDERGEQLALAVAPIGRPAHREIERVGVRLAEELRAIVHGLHDTERPLDRDGVYAGEPHARLSNAASSRSKPAAVDHRAQCPRPPLAERAFEARLLAKRGVASTTRRTRAGERARIAARDTREADLAPEIEERLTGGGRKRVPGAFLDPADVRVNWKHRFAEGESAHSVRRVAPDAGQVRQVVGPARLGDDLRRTVE